MAYCFNPEDGYHQICDESDCGESPSDSTSLGRHRKPWQWVWRWVSVKKTCLCKAFAINNGDGSMWGCCRRISWRNVCWKIRADLTRMIKPRPASHMTFRYDALSYALNFDDGGYYQHGPDNVQHFNCRFVGKIVPFGSQARHLLCVQIHTSCN